MFDPNAIAQLSQLKKAIIDSKDVAEGVVVGANGRFGFVKLDDGRDVFLNPDRMQRVLPGDRVRINVTKNSKDQLEGELETLLSSELHRFVGQYKIKGNAHFVVPEDKHQNRWLFIPPQNRARCQEDDLVLAEVLRHPYEDGKAAARVVTRIGSPDSDYIHQNLITARFDLFRDWSKDALKQARQCAQRAETARNQTADHTRSKTAEKTEPQLAQHQEPQPSQKKQSHPTNESPRADLTHVPFVTIDSAATRDMDDALYIEARPDGGWSLWVAIADPASSILPGSPLAKTARFYAQSVYLPGRSLPMLPDPLATDTFSLVAGQLRPALICRMEWSNEGAIDKFTFEHANIQSRHKLSYQAVGQYLNGDANELTDCEAAILDNLKMLHQAVQARLNYRQTHHLMQEEQPDYDWVLTSQGLIEKIHRRERTAAHRVVEEAMVAANLCAGQYLEEHGRGLFTTHAGFRPERLGEVKALLQEELGDEAPLEELETLPGFMTLIRTLHDGPHRHLLAPLKRMMSNAELSTTPAPHLNMGFAHYATITSPLRRYADLCNHWSINQILQTQKAQTLPDKVLQQLSDTLTRGRQACRQLEQTLAGHFLRDKIGMETTGVIRIVTQQGFGVRFLDTGLEGFVQIPKKVKKTFDAKRMTLTVGERCYALNDEVAVRVEAVDLDKRRVKLGLQQTSETEVSEGEAAAADVTEAEASKSTVSESTTES